MHNNRFFGTLGLAHRAGRCAVGEGAALDCLRRGAARLVVLAEDASDNTKKRFENGCIHHKTELVVRGCRTELGRSTGREFAVVVAVKDEGFAKSLTKTE